VDKRTPHYSLVDLKIAVASLGVAAFTKSALDGGRLMGLTSTEMLGVVLALRRKDFYKSMTTYVDPRIWQDVYHARTVMGPAYVKFTLRTGAVVISFKRL
jgi:motility quorum-sensing regulator / GCU-specific mRNA interferase toxin